MAQSRFVAVQPGKTAFVPNCLSHLRAFARVACIFTVVYRPIGTLPLRASDISSRQVCVCVCVCVRQQAWLERLALLHEHGLPLEYALSLLRTWSQSAAVYVQRCASVSGEWSQRVDDQMVQAYGRLVRTQLSKRQRALLFL